MAWVATPLLLSLTLFTISTAHGSPSPTLPQDSEATITVTSEIIVVIPADTILDSTTIKLGSAGVSVDGHIVSADIAYDLLVNGSVIFEGQTGVFTTSSTTTLRTTNSGRSSSSSILAGSTSNSNTVGNTVISSATSLANSSLQPWSTGSRGSLSTNTGYVVVNGTVSALSSSLRLNSTAAFPDISSPSPVPTWSSTNFAPSKPYTVAPAATSSPGISSFAQKSIPLIGSIANVSPSSSPLRPMTTVSIAPSASSNKAQTMFSSILINNSTGSQTSFGPSTPSQSVSSQSLKTGSGPSSGLSISANTSSGALVLGPGNQPNTITSGPSMAIPTVSWNPTGSAASSQGILLVGVIFRITDEAKTLTDILKDGRPKESFISKIKGADDEVFELFKDVNPPGFPPSYDGSCLDGASILNNIFKVLGCLKSGLDKVIELLGIEPPDVPKIEIIFDNLGNLANNLKKEEDDTKTQSSRIKSSSTSFSSIFSVSSSASASTSSRMSSEIPKTFTLSSSSTVSSTAVAGLDPSPIFDYNQSDDSGPDISDQAMMAFFGDLLSSAIGIGPGLSGFTTSTTASNATLTTTSQPRPASSAVTETSAAAGATTSRATSASSAGRGYNPTSSIISPSHDITVPSAPRSTNPPMSIPVNPPLMCTLL
ncbi:MAG: hypothetical protein Q9175_001451 [Cornicularia normoerica]